MEVFDGSAFLKRTLRGRFREKDRSQTKGSSKVGSSCHQRSECFAQKENTISQEAESCSRSRSVGSASPIVHGECPVCDVSQMHSSSCVVPSAPPKEDCSAEAKPHKLDDSPAPPNQLLSFPKWCASLLTQVFRSRTPFARFVLDSISAHRSDLTSSPSLFPIPVLFGDHLGRMPPGANKRKRSKIHIARATHVIVMALNYLHCGASRYLGGNFRICITMFIAM